MRKLYLKMSMSLDGFVAGPNGESDWIFATADPRSNAWEVEVVSNVSLHLMGSTTYADMLAWWPQSKEVWAAAMNEIPKAVFTRRNASRLLKLKPSKMVTKGIAAQERAGKRRKKADPEVLRMWLEPYVASGKMKKELAKLKRQGGKPMMAHGGAGFARSLIATGMVDRFYLLVHPVVLGQGLPIFTKLDKQLGLKLHSSTAFPGGAIAQVYEPRDRAGEASHASGRSKVTRQKRVLAPRCRSRCR